MLQVTNFIALHMQQIINTYYTTDNSCNIQLLLDADTIFVQLIFSTAVSETVLQGFAAVNARLNNGGC